MVVWRRKILRLYGLRFFNCPVIDPAGNNLPMSGSSTSIDRSNSRTRRPMWRRKILRLS